MAIHIVTSRCFLACDRVLSVKLEEYPIDDPDRPPPTKKPKKGRPAKKQPRTYESRITIVYCPMRNGANNNYDSEYTLEIVVRERDKAVSLYGEIVKEVQEQNPNEAYLDQLVNRILVSDDFKVADQPKAIG